MNVAQAVSKNELTAVKKINDNAQDYTKVKFIPASGAATRMFKNSYTYIDTQKNTAFIDDFFDHLEEFAFSEYFNPVDLVCFMKDYKGDKFDLMEYANEERISSVRKCMKENH